MDAVLRLTWALPLVLALGACAMFLLRRLVAPQTHGSRAASRMIARETLAVSGQTRIHLIEIDGNGYLVVESMQTATLQCMDAAHAAVRATRSQPAWLRRWAGATR